MEGSGPISRQTHDCRRHDCMLTPYIARQRCTSVPFSSASDETRQDETGGPLRDYLWRSSCGFPCQLRGGSRVSTVENSHFSFVVLTLLYTVVWQNNSWLDMARDVSSFVGALYSHTLSSLTPLGLTGLLVLADLDVIAQRTILNGTPAWSDALIICPGLHRQHKAGTLSDGEFPACAAMTTGYVFRVENPATVFYLQSVSETGKLTNVCVSKAHVGPAPYVNLGHLAVASSVLAIASLASVQDWWALAYLLVLVLVRLINTAILRSQATAVGWHGQEEPGQLGDLFILLSYDWWVRMRGEVDDLKAVTSGRWLQPPTTLQDTMSACATLLAYAAPTLTANATPQGQIVIGLLLLPTLWCSLSPTILQTSCT
jgi:hypothetical protein